MVTEVVVPEWTLARHSAGKALRLQSRRGQQLGKGGGHISAIGERTGEDAGARI